ncbi:cell envelope integrity protein TolA [Pseudoxanthomonas sp. SGNA-20]|jgi:TolA protein|uniref:cell envelope integrity protein TolA n=1 Tax=unclassified Pseudoxanthomonas TaxID=2645906 RepID=UPI00037E9C44|nr:MULTISPECIES: cell envelope integrity protein TolA [unclassified Pseudoxanthomonas]RRN58784.1 cell envelope integrity protein TolA [Pseudoxanthomonas sp. SGNA-20]RRN81218.1 cell envelope integrity protein TolA [Pseudoxanthomonas sp. SGD-10]
MHADAFYHRPEDRESGLAGPLLLALALHIGVALLFWLAWWWSPQRKVEPAAGSPAIEASLVMSPADLAAAQRRAEEAPKPEPLPEPVAETAPEETVPPPQPLPEPRPQDATVQPQQKAQDFIPQPDTVDQDEARRDAIAKEKAEKEQEERRRQQQIDLTEQQRQKEAENQRRLAAQAEEAERQKKLAEIRRQREQAAREAERAEQRLRQLQQVQQRQSAPAQASQGSPGQGGTSEDLTAKYAAAIQQAVTNQWIRPDTVPLGQRCRVQIRQLPGGEVIDVKVQPGCPYDEAGQRSLEAAVLRAQPLPYRGFESVFQRTLILNFEARDR